MLCSAPFWTLGFIFTWHLSFLHGKINFLRMQQHISPQWPVQWHYAYGDCWETGDREVTLKTAAALMCLAVMQVLLHWTAVMLFKYNSIFSQNCISKNVFADNVRPFYHEPKNKLHLCSVHLWLSHYYLTARLLIGRVKALLWLAQMLTAEQHVSSYWLFC